MENMNQQPLEVLLQILQDSLEQKLLVLTAIEQKSKEQSVLVSNPEVALDDIDKNMEEKSQLIDKLTRLDGGFETLYNSIREELLDKKDAYKSQIAKIQDLISKVMEKSASIEVIEARNKTAIEGIFRNRKKDLQHKKNVSTVARQYYQSANKLTVIPPQFLDKKK